jgi:hypothetical protein
VTAVDEHTDEATEGSLARDGLCHSRRGDGRWGDRALAERLLDRLVRAELVPPDSEVSLMPQALDDLAQRLLHVLGEYDVPPG